MIPLLSLYCMYYGISKIHIHTFCVTLTSDVLLLEFLIVYDEFRQCFCYDNIMKFLDVFDSSFSVFGKFGRPYMFKIRVNYGI